MAPSDYKTLALKKFIKTVRMNKCLYDMNYKKNFTPKKIESIWRKIAIEFRLESITQAKRKWSYLISRYKNCLRDQSKKSKYYSDLNFLYSFVLTIDDVEDNEVKFLIKKERLDNSYSINRRENSSERLMSLSSGRNNSRHLSNENHPSTSSSRQSVFSDGSYFSVPIYFSREALSIDNNEDELKPFFESMYRSTIKLPLSLQRDVKTQFFKIITATEEKAVNKASK